MRFVLKEKGMLTTKKVFAIVGQPLGQLAANIIWFPLLGRRNSFEQ
jgi:hypothetical protein